MKMFSSTSSGVLMAVVALAAHAATATASGGVFDVTTFGATGDGATKDTEAIRAACAAVVAARGGTLLFPAPGTYYTGAFNLTSNIVVKVEKGATVLGSTDGDDWPVIDIHAEWPQFGDPPAHQALVFAWRANNITLTGGGTIDGNSNSKTWWRCDNHNYPVTNPPCNGFSRPRVVEVFEAQDVVMSDLTVQNSPNWNIHFSSVKNLHVHGISVIDPGDSPNTDGIDLDCVTNALVEDSYFSVGDDALCVKSGRDYDGRLYAHPSRDIVFRNIRVGTGHGITIGSESSGGVHNVTFENIEMTGTSSGPRIKSQRGRGGVVDGITYRNVTARNLGDMVQLTLNYHTGLSPTNKTATPVMRNVLIEDCTFTAGKKSDARRPNAGVVDGLPESHIQNVTFRNVNLNGGNAQWQTCQYVDNGVCEGSTNACPPCFEDRTN